MGRNSSGTRGGLQPGDATYKGSVGKPEPLVNMKDPALYKATKEAISRYHSVLGVRQKNVKLAELSAGTYGVHVTANGKSEGVYLNLKSATKLFSVLLASKRPLITELADKLRLKYPLLPTISPCPTMRLEAIRSIIPISCRRYPKSV